MAYKKFLVDLDLGQNELRSAIIENLATAPDTPKEGQIYFHSVTNNKKLKYYRDGAWKKLIDEDDITSFVPNTRTINGKALSSDITLYGTDIAMSDSDATTLKAAIDGKQATITGAATTITSSNLTANRVLISNGSGKVAVSSSVTTTELGYLDGVTSAIQTQIDNKVTKNSDITAATHTKITYDAKGLVTGGSDLSATDIPDIASSKVTAMTGYTKGSSADPVAATDSLNTAVSKLENQIDNKVTKNADITASSTGKTVITYDSKGLVTGGSEIAIDSGSTNYLEFVTSSHKIKAKVDTTVTASSTKLITSGAVATAIQNAIAGGVIYQGTWDITSATDLSGITLPVKKGYMYLVTGTGPKTIDGVEWNAGDYLLVNDDVASGGSLSGKVEKIDNTEAADIVRTDATQTLTNKTIDADDNTISDLELDNFKTGVVQTSVRASSSATNTSVATEKAVRTELDKKANLASPTFTGTPKAPTAAVGTNTTQIATTAFVQAAIASASLTLAENNPALTASGGLCTWTITNTLNNADVVCSIREVGTGEEVYANITYTAASITIKINSSSNISAGTYRAVVIGQKVAS